MPTIIRPDRALAPTEQTIAGGHCTRSCDLTGRTSMLLVPLVPMALSAVHGAAAIPIFTAGA
jgi:hypothetical protein